MAGELYDGAGNRKYLTAEERAAFLKAADRAPRPVVHVGSDGRLPAAFDGCVSAASAQFV